MKEINLKLRKGWHWVESDKIYNVLAPVGAICKCATPDKNSAASIAIFIYRSNSTILQECANMSEIVHGGEPMQFQFAGYPAFGLRAGFCRGQITMFYFFVEIENFIACFQSIGTDSQALKNMEWMEKHFSLGDEIPNENGNPLEGESPLVPPAMLFQMVDFSQRDYSVSRPSCYLNMSFFDFIVKASLVPALDAEDLVEKVNQDYTRHLGYREIEYENLSDEALEILAGLDDPYIGIGAIEENPYGAIVQRVLLVDIGDELVEDFIIYRDGDVQDTARQISDKVLQLI